MTMVNIHQAKTNLSKLLEEVMQGHEIIIAKAGTPIATLTPFHPKKPKRKFGTMKGSLSTSHDFDEPLPEKFFESTLFPSKGKK